MSIKTALLLSHHSIDVNQQSHIQLWVHDGHVPALLHITKQKSYFFVETQQNTVIKKILLRLPHQYELKELPHRNFEQQEMTAYYFPSMLAFFKAKELLHQQDITLYEDDISLSDRFLMERFIKGGLCFEADAIKTHKSYIEYDVTKLKRQTFSLKSHHLRTVFIDVNCNANDKLLSIGMHIQHQQVDIKTTLMIGDEADHASDTIRWFDNEKDLINGFSDTINEFNPDLIVGWDEINIDLKKIISRARFHGLTLDIGRGKKSANWRNHPKDMSKSSVHVYGSIVIDGIGALKQASYHFESFCLQYIASKLLSSSTEMVNQNLQASEIEKHFIHNKQALAEYSLQNCQLISNIFNVTGIINYLLYRQQLTGLNIDKMGGSVSAFTHLYLPQLHRANYIAPNIPKKNISNSPGGYVMDSQPGLYRNVFVLDFKSLYPSIIRTFNIDPMGLIEGLMDKDSSIKGFQGAEFSREKHFLPKIIEDLWQERELAKKENDLVRSQAIKIIMNSFYGVLGSSGCRFYDNRLASSVTLRGHEIMQETKQWIEEQNYKVIYGDTDSIFVIADKTIDKEQVQSEGRRLANFINKKWSHVIAERFELSSYLELEMETVYERFFMPTIRGQQKGSKKRYVGLQTDEGNTQVVFKGMEAVRSDWTLLAKKFQLGLYQYVFSDKDPSEFIKKTIDALYKGEKDDQLIFRKQLKRPLQQYKKNKQLHVQAAIKADMHNLQHGEPLRYQEKSTVEFILTTAGPEVFEQQTHAIDYEAYVEKQLKSVADAILPYLNLSFDRILSSQIRLI